MHKDHLNFRTKVQAILILILLNSKTSRGKNSIAFKVILFDNETSNEHKSPSPLKSSSHTKSKTSTGDTFSSRQPKSPSKQSSTSKSIFSSSSKNPLEKTHTSSPRRYHQGRSESSVRGKQNSPTKEPKRQKEAPSAGQKRQAKSPLASTLPNKFARQRTLSDSSSYSSSSSDSTSSSSSSDSFTGMEDNIFVSPPPGILSPLPPDGCPVSPKSFHKM